MSNAIASLDDSSAADWSRILYAFLAEKERRSGSLRKVQNYRRTLKRVLSCVGTRIRPWVLWQKRSLQIVSPVSVHSSISEAALWRIRATSRGDGWSEALGSSWGRTPKQL